MNKETLTRSERVEEYSGENRIKREGSLQETTEGVNILLGDPRKAIVKLSIPIIVAMPVQTIYNLTGYLLGCRPWKLMLWLLSDLTGDFLVYGRGLLRVRL